MDAKRLVAPSSFCRNVDSHAYGKVDAGNIRIRMQRAIGSSQTGNVSAKPFRSAH
jgi:hypothetical protein